MDRRGAKGGLRKRFGLFEKLTPLGGYRLAFRISRGHTSQARALLRGIASVLLFCMAMPLVGWLALWHCLCVAVPLTSHTSHIYKKKNKQASLLEFF